MQLLSDDDLNLKDMTPEELDAAWNLCFDLAQSTNDFDPPYTHGVFAGLKREDEAASGSGEVPGAKEGDIVLMFYCTTKQEAKLMEPEKFSEWKWVLIKDYIAGESYSGFNPLARKMITDYLLKINQ